MSEFRKIDIYIEGKTKKSFESTGGHYILVKEFFFFKLKFKKNNFCINNKIISEAHAQKKKLRLSVVAQGSSKRY